MAQYLEDWLPDVRGAGLNTQENTSIGGTLAVTGTSAFTGVATFTATPVFNGTTAPAAANGNLYPIVNPSTAPVAYAGDATLVAADLNKNVTNTGSSGTVVLTLPAIAGTAGSILHVEVTVAQIVRLLPVAGTAIALGGSAVVTKYLNIAGVIGNMVDLYSNGTAWLVVGRDGVITKEA